MTPRSTSPIYVVAVRGSLNEELVREHGGDDVVPGPDRLAGERRGEAVALDLVDLLAVLALVQRDRQERQPHLRKQEVRIARDRNETVRAERMECAAGRIELAVLDRELGERRLAVRDDPQARLD